MDEQGKAETQAAADLFLKATAPLRQLTSELVNVVTADGEQRRKESAQQRKATRLIAAAIVVAIVVLAGLAFLVVQDTQRRAQSRDLVRQNAETSQRIADCTTAGGQCYEDGARRSGAAIAELIRAQAAVGRCTVSEDTVAEYDLCVKRALTPRPTP